MTIRRPTLGATLALTLVVLPAMAQAPPVPALTSLWKLQKSPVTVALRGLSVVSDRVAWASGASGTVLRTIDGETWQVMPVAGAEGLDFRDIEAFDQNTAVAMSIGPGQASNVYKTSDGGASWWRVFANAEPTGFWDAITFWDTQHGALFGDPVRGRFQVFTTDDGGESWKGVPEAGMPQALENEGAFAASGSCLMSGPGKRLAFVTGGASEARVFVSTDRGRTFKVSTSPVPGGAPSKGLFSVMWLNDKTLLTVGGDYKLPDLDGIKAAVSGDGGARWTSLRASPGFLSSVGRGPAKDGSVVAVGLSGTGISADGGKTWKTIDTAPYHTVGFEGSATVRVRAGWAVGPKGAIARWEHPPAGRP